ncbi:AsmA family protein [Roseobacter weihaiensis]|uniref:AsmA family protein n=1 Tax=Roseobacter weihaiensis TaxID=2763262 RepID=UPI001D0B0468|nr:AsmA-like C-terminal region-containing protein [Roseobacter sp. H9]
MQLRMGLRRLASGLRWWLVWIVAIGAGAYLLGPALVPERLVQAQISNHVGHWTGGAYRLHADAEIAIEPGFRVIVSDPAFVSVSDADAAPVLTADTIVAPLRILPLLFGRVEIAELMLLRPDIDLQRPAEHFAASVPPGGRGGASTGRTRQFSEVILVDGTLRFGGMMGRHKVSGLNLRLGADEVTDAVAIKGGVFLGARHLRVDLQLDDLRALISDSGTQASLKLRVGPRHHGEEGEVAASDPGIPYEITEKLRQAAETLGLSAVGLGSMVVEGMFSVTPQVVAISDATFSLDGLEAEGHLRAETADRPVMAQLLGLPATVSALVAGVTEMDNNRWVDVPVTLAGFDGLDLDFALTGDTLPIGDLTLDRAALSLVVRDGTTSLDLSGNREGLGHVQAGLSLEQGTGEPVRLTAAGRVDAMSVGQITQFLAAIGPPPPIGTPQLPEGMMNGTFNVNARGNTLGQLVDSLNGSVRAQLKDGSLTGTDLVATLETLVRGREFMTEEHGPLIPAAGRTPFDQLDARVDLVSGTASVSEVHIAGERFGINMLGEVQLTEGTMNVGGNAVLLALSETGSRSENTLVDLPFGVGGTVFAPVVAAGVPTVTAARVDAYDED